MAKPRNTAPLDVDAQTIYLSLVDGSQLECIVIDIFSLSDKRYEGNQYIMLSPANEKAEFSNDAFFYRYGGRDKSNYSLYNIESDEEYDLVVETANRRKNW